MGVDLKPLALSVDDTLLLINWQSQSKAAEIMVLVGFLLPPKEPALSTTAMNDDAGKLLPFFRGEQTASHSAIPELTWGYLKPWKQ